jgi:hypothetical protein
MMEGVNSTMIYCKNFCTCHNVPQYNNNNNNTEKARCLFLTTFLFQYIKGLRNYDYSQHFCYYGKTLLYDRCPFLEKAIPMLCQTLILEDKIGTCKIITW